MLAVFNYLDVFSADVGNVYLNGPCRDKIWKNVGPEFGSQQECVMLILRSLYGLKSSGASCKEMLEETMGKEGPGYTSTTIDKDVCIKKAVFPDGKEYYSRVLVYIDDILCIHKDTLVVIDALVSIYIMKEVRMGPPDRYLGSNTKKMQTQDGKVMWATHSRDYCKAVIANTEKTLMDDGKRLL